jgi:hypothetical protein
MYEQTKAFVLAHKESRDEPLGFHVVAYQNRGEQTPTRINLAHVVDGDLSEPKVFATYEEAERVAYWYNEGPEHDAEEAHWDSVQGRWVTDRYFRRSRCGYNGRDYYTGA